MVTQEADGESVVEMSPAADAKVSVTISVKGELAKAKDGSTMAQKEVIVKDLDSNGKLTVDEALTAAHNAYYNGGAASGYGVEVSEQYGTTITKLWGDTSRNFGYWDNDTSCRSLDDEVKANDNLVAFVYKDASRWTDAYAKFTNKEYTVEAGKLLDVALEKAGYDSNYNTVFSAYEGAVITAYDSQFQALDSNAYSVSGNQVTFQNAGEYYLVATGTEPVILVPAVAKVTVTEATVPQVIAEGTCGKTASDAVSWKLTDDGILRISGSGAMKNYHNMIPALKNPWVKNYAKQVKEVVVEGNVSSIGNYAFYQLTALKKVSLSDSSVTSIETSAFEKCTNLETVVLGNTLTAIKGNAFKGCGLKEFTLSENLTSISSTAFGVNNSLETLHINSIAELKGNIFGQCKGLKNITVGKNVSGLNKELFSNAPSVESLTVDSENTNVIIQDDMLYSSDGKTLLYCVPQKQGKATIKEGTEIIGENAFSNCTKITEISLPESMSTLKDYAFAGCTGLTRLELPATVTDLKAYAFQNCTSLKELIVRGDKYVTEGSLLYTSDKKTLVLCLPYYEGSISVANGVECIGEAAFYGCQKITEITLPSTVKTIENSALYGCSGLTKLELPDGITAIGNSAFNGCSGLTKLELPDGITAIGDSTFNGCSGLTKMVLPNSVTSVGERAFQNCTSLTEAVLSSGQNAITKYMFGSCNNLTKIQIPEGITQIDGYAFSGCSSLQELKLPESLETFTGSRQLNECSSLTTITIPEKVTSIPDEMFFECTKLGSIVVPTGVTSIRNLTWNGAPLDVNIQFKGSPKQWYNIEKITSAENKRTNITFYYGAPTDNTMVEVQPEAVVYREGTATEDITPLSVHMAEVKEGESYEYTWFCNSTQETLREATMLSGETVTDDGRTSEYKPDVSQAGTYNYYCIIAKKDAEGNVLASTVTNVAKVAVVVSSLQGSGTEKDPYQMSSQEDLTALYNLVAAGNSMKGVFFKMTKDITLDTNWKPIGTSQNTSFGGNYDGADHKLTIAQGGLPLLGYVKGAEVKNLKIFGEQIEGAGLVNNYAGIDLDGSAIVIDNVRLLSGSKTLKSGLVAASGENIFAYASAGFVVTIRNCVIEKDVTVGYTGDQNQIGSFAGRINGTIENCESYATVKGNSYVGGILGTRDNAMSRCDVKNAKFHGTVEGNSLVGGIVGGGYDNASAPNGAVPTILNCSVDGTVKGDTYVGGIFGGDLYVAQSWDNVGYSISANKFTGNINGNQYVGAIIGYLDSLNRYNNIAGNTFKATDSVKTGIGFVKYLDTSYEKPAVMEGTVAFNTGKNTTDCPKVDHCDWKANCNRTDDPLGKDADAIAKATNTSESICYELKYDGICKTEYQIGEDLDLTGLEITGYWDNNTVTRIDLKDIAISGYNKNQTGKQSVALSYGAAKLYIVVTVIPKSTTVTVTVSILGDEKHGDTKTPHGLKKGGLVTWASEKVQADTTNTVWDVLKKFMDDHKITYKADDKNSHNTIYISYVNGLGEFDNGPKSGWMYTVNGIHPNVGVADKYIQDKDEIILHYTDDHTTEEQTEYNKAMVKEVTDAINAIPSVDRLTSADKAQVAAARAAYDMLTEEQKAQVTAETLSKLTAAEARIAELEVPPSHVHAYGEWTKISDATVFAPEKQERTCSCGAKETRDYGSVLKATIKVNATTVPLKVKQKTSAFKVTGLANGDSVQSYKSSNTKIFTVTKSGVLKAGKKTGKATLTITLASGLQKKVTVKVQKKKVTTSKITGLQKKVTLKKGAKLTLAPSRTPITSTQKFTYKSSNKKIATVSSKGVITGKKAGKTKITVKSGKKKYTVTVTVTK